MATCNSCFAQWDRGQFTPACKTCGGGALEIACIRCSGECGQWYERAVADSNDRRIAIWRGACGLPVEEQRARMQALYPQADLSNMPFVQATTPPRERAPTSKPVAPIAVPVARAVAAPVEHVAIGGSTTASELAQIVAAMRAIDEKWRGIRTTMAMDPEDGSWAKNNSRYATSVADAIAALKLAAYPRREVLYRAVLALIDDTPCHEPAATARDELRAALAKIMRGSGVSR